MAVRMEVWFKKWARDRSVKLAHELAKVAQEVVGVQAPTRRTPSGRVVAAVPATPYAPPRRVTGAGQKSIRVIPMPNGARLVVGKAYMVFLEKSSRFRGWPHKWLQVAMERVGLKGVHNP